MDRDVARNWIERWDRQQEVTLPDREERFTALIDAVEEGTGRPDPLILDIGCGPGSLAARISERLPAATIIGIDADPVTLALARTVYPRIRFEDLDLRVPGWTGRLDLDRPAGAAVSTTALHWLPEEELRACYAELASVLAPGGLLLNGDHFIVEDKTLARLERGLRVRADARCFPSGHAESWEGWWQAVSADPAFAELTAERDRRRVAAGHHAASESQHLTTHVSALKAAGFAEIGTLWQRGDSRILCAVMPD